MPCNAHTRTHAHKRMVRRKQLARPSANKPSCAPNTTRPMPVHEMELISFFVSLRGCYLSGYPLFFLAPSSFVFAVYCSPVFACECWQVLNRMRRAKYFLSFLAKKESVMGLDLRSIQDRQITIAFQLHVF